MLNNGILQAQYIPGAGRCANRDCTTAIIMKDIIAQYPNEFILLQDGEVKWHNPEGMLRVSRRKLAGKHRNHAMFFKYVDPEEREAEHFEVYEQNLAIIKNLKVKMHRRGERDE